LLAFGGNTRHHRLFAGVEDAGYEIRDTLTYHFGSGFPKALDVSKSIDSQADAEREIVGKNPNRRTGRENTNTYERGNDTVASEHITAPATDAAEQWDGFKTALKPATEFVVMARAPLAEDTVAENVLEWGTGALNIDGCRIETEGRPNRENSGARPGDATSYDLGSREATGTTTEGRYPANVVFDETAAAALDREVGDIEGGSAGGSISDGEKTMTPVKPGTASYDDNGGPSRYFYTSKATRAERTLDGRIDNAHPTVKPQDLMEWLVTLVTAEGQTVLDPFAGTGTTGRAAKDKGREFVLIEQDEQWADVARVRCGLSPNDPSHVRSNDAQTGLEGYTDD
jgi:site-specific DNA-methyltransferase (adenine-specific)